MKPERAAKILAQTRMFSGIDVTTLERVAERCIERSYKKGQLIFHQGDPGESLFVVVEGFVKVLVPSPEGGEIVLVTLEPHATFGELALIDGGPRSASAEALGPTNLLVLTRATLLDLFADHPQLTDTLLRSFGAIIRRLTEQAADLVFLDLHGRVAKLLTALADEQREPDATEVVLDLHMTQTDLASMVGGSRQSVNQILRGLADQGYLEIHGRTIVVKRLELLRKRAGP
ncbi:MAG: Crp/Fnr family transcriptional regulator [Actinomycetota bacterium]|nr:Crp/Fnr family transcriptional regulator [Actinomycetota bacterium]